MAVPAKYREIGDFHEYYSGARTAPYLTIFVGGNHEASNHLWELYYGGWVAPNIYYMGAANVLGFGPLRIAGMSGIWKGYDYRKPHFERIPYSFTDLKTVYHTREMDVRKLLQLRSQIDIAISHDWPKSIEWVGDHKQLFKAKPYFQEDARNGQLGSPAARYVLDWLRPRYWFSAHLHVKYSAFLEHEKSSPEKAASGRSLPVSLPTTIQKPVANENEISLDMDDEGEEASNNNTTAPNLAYIPKATLNKDEINLEDDLDDEIPTTTAKTSITNGTTVHDPIPPSPIPPDIRSQLPTSFTKPPTPTPEPYPSTTINNTTTRFLALDKPLPNRDFLQLLELPQQIDDDALPLVLKYDPEYLAIRRTFALNEPLQLGDLSARVPPDKGRAHYARLIDAERAWVDEHIVSAGKDTIPENFSRTAPVYDAAKGLNTGEGPREYDNPQTGAFCETLGIPNPFFAEEEEREERLAKGPRVEDGGEGRGRGGGGRGRGRGGGRGGSRGGGRGFGGGRARGRGRG